MIKLTFSYNRDLMKFIVKDREIFYTDARWGSWVRCVPQPENFMKVVALSRNRIPSYLLTIFKLTPEEQKEYELSTTEQELADIVIRDAKSKGCIFISQSNELTGEDNLKGVVM